MENTDKKTEVYDIRRVSSHLQRVFSVIFGIIEIVLAFRLIFKLLGANAANGFVHGIYYITHFLVGIFEGIFSKTATGLENAAVFEPATLIAMIVVALIALIIVELINSGSKTRISTSEVSEHNNQLK